MNTYSLVYRTGGTRAANWHRVMTEFKFENDAKVAAFDIIQMGYKCLIFRTDELNAHGLPIGWEPELVDHEDDTIEVSKYVTKWVKSAS